MNPAHPVRMSPSQVQNQTLVVSKLLEQIISRWASSKSANSKPGNTVVPSKDQSLSSESRIREACQASGGTTN